MTIQVEIIANIKYSPIIKFVALMNFKNGYNFAFMKSVGIGHITPQ